MITIKGYQQTTIAALTKLLAKEVETNNIPTVNIAAAIGAKAAQTVRNALALNEHGEQQVSDSVLSKVMKALDVDGLILYFNGEKYYYIK